MTKGINLIFWNATDKSIEVMSGGVFATIKGLTDDSLDQDVAGLTAGNCMTLRGENAED